MMKFISLIYSRGINRLLRTTLLTSLISLVICVPAAYADDPSQHKILILGDSISAAYGMRQQEGWVQLLQNDLEDSVTIINASVSGETTAGGLQRLPPLLKEHKPSIVIIELGGNDGLRGYPILSIRKNLHALITQSANTGAQVLLLGMKIPPNYGKRYTDAFEQNYVQLADKLKVPLVPFILESIAGRRKLMQSDGIHPTADAQALIVQNVLPSLRDMLD
ncbi:arylesterase [Zhongshania aquimaris]|uniref:Arylesterase n=1 Tax=Zhongshania aquimaris TaxID=2857107 RepID=A0ABS6VMX7_9GAMM|nr:arylesterase [Zhongshania aquimaris]MBW2939389.1 arylesterase [Zhongshania aquimaris]